MLLIAAHCQAWGDKGWGMTTQRGRVGQREAWGCEDAPTRPSSWESREGFPEEVTFQDGPELDRWRPDREASCMCPGQSRFGISFRRVKGCCGDVRAGVNYGLGRQSSASCQETSITLV